MSPETPKEVSRKSEPDDIRQARQDITNAAAEYEQVHTACTVAGRKLQQARERLDALLQAPRRDA